MILPDVNVLIYAFQFDSPYYEVSRTWLTSVITGDQAYGISPQVVSSFLRIATNPKIYSQPAKRNMAWDFARNLMERPQCHLIQPGPRHWGIFVRLCEGANATGNLVQDAWFAALAIESGCEWITYDTDYARFKGLRWRMPD